VVSVFVSDECFVPLSWWWLFDGGSLLRRCGLGLVFRHATMRLRLFVRPTHPAPPDASVLPAQWASETQFMLPFALFPPHRDVVDKAVELFNGNSVWFDVVDVDVKPTRTGGPTADVGIGGIIGNLLSSRVLFLLVALVAPSSGVSSLLLLDLRAAVRGRSLGAGPRDVSPVYAVWYLLDPAATSGDMEEAFSAAVSRYVDAVQLHEGVTVSSPPIGSGGASASGGRGRDGGGDGDGAPSGGGGGLAGSGAGGAGGYDPTAPAKPRKRDRGVHALDARIGRGTVEVQPGGNDSGAPLGVWVPFLAIVSRVGRTLAGAQGQLSLVVSVPAAFSRTAHRATLAQKAAAKALAQSEERDGDDNGGSEALTRKSAKAVHILRECMSWLRGLAELLPTPGTGSRLAGGDLPSTCVCGGASCALRCVNWP
jgi:hypothetical protein